MCRRGDILISIYNARIYTAIIVVFGGRMTSPLLNRIGRRIILAGVNIWSGHSQLKPGAGGVTFCFFFCSFEFRLNRVNVLINRVGPKCARGHFESSWSRDKSFWLNIQLPLRFRNIQTFALSVFSFISWFSLFCIFENCPNFLANSQIETIKFRIETNRRTRCSVEWKLREDKSPENRKNC